MGFYTTPPARRWAYDAEGVSVYRFKSGDGSSSALSAGDVNTLNGEADTPLVTLNPTGGTSAGPWYLCFVFAEARKLTHAAIFLDPITGKTFTVDIEHSDDTTDGLDGSWATTANDVGDLALPVRPAYREGITNPAAAAPHLGYRFKITPSGTISQSALKVAIVHLYGLEAGPTDRLAFWHPTSDIELAADLDLGDVARVGSSTLTFRIKNLSALTASAITLASGQGVSYGTSAGWTLLSTDDSIYADNITPADLAPGAISPVLYAKAAPDSDDELSVHVCRITGAATFS